MATVVIGDTCVQSISGYYVGNSDKLPEAICFVIYCYHGDRHACSMYHSHSRMLTIVGEREKSN